VSTADPQRVSAGNEIQVTQQVFTPLLGFTTDYRIAQNGAESYTISPDGKTYTFKVRSGMTYSDGKPVTAQDYAYAIKRACDPVVAGNYSFILYIVKGCQAWREADVTKDKAKLPQMQSAVDQSIRALDDQTLEIQLTQSAGYFPYIMATWITDPVRKDLVDAGGHSQAHVPADRLPADGFPCL
jgi:oligopeptide transport system substrate-binding protein